MSDTDSFIEEVSEEVRRDQLFATLRRYGWIAALLVVVVVGGAAFNEYRKASARAEAQALGDALLGALEQENAGAALAEVAAGSDAVAARMLAAAALEEEGNFDAAAEQFDAIVAANDVPAIYRDVALLKAVMLRSDTLSADERRTRLAGLASPGNPLRLLAEEQLALIDVEEGNLSEAETRLNAIESDAEASTGLRLRVGQLKLALGFAPAAPQTLGEEPE